MASIIGGDLSRGIGIAPAVDLQVYRVLDTGGRGDAFTLAEGIVQAADRGANIINMSLGAPPGSAESAVLNSALDYAMEKGVLIVAAAGNDGAGELGYPANRPGVISVAAGDAAWQSLPSSNVGYPSFTAPGYAVPAANAGALDAVSFSTGTSPAAAVLSGILAAEMSRDPSASTEELLATLRQNSNDFGEPGNDAVYGYGLPDPLRLARRGSQTLDVASAAAFVSEQDENSVTVRVTAQNRGTVPLAQGQLFIDAGGIKSQPSLSGLAPNETRAFPITIPKNRLEPGQGIPITVTTGTGFATDSRPENDSLRKVLYLVPDAE
jgi:hypothetical protein